MTGSATKQSMPLRHCERSEAIHLAAQRKNGLLRRCAPRNDGGALVQNAALPAIASQLVAQTRALVDRLREANPCLSVIASAAKQSMPQKRMDCFVAALPCNDGGTL